MQKNIGKTMYKIKTGVEEVNKNGEAIANVSIELSNKANEQSIALEGLVEADVHALPALQQTSFAYTINASPSIYLKTISLIEGTLNSWWPLTYVSGIFSNTFFSKVSLNF